jgi:hypothetical protein
MGTVFFISPQGEIIPGEINHINTVIKYSDKFGYSRDRIEKIYRYHNERVGLEGKARLKIIVDLVSKGWIRIRRQSNRWSITVWQLTQEVKQLLCGFVCQVWDGEYGDKRVDKYMPFWITEICNKKIASLFFEELLASIDEKS